MLLANQSPLPLAEQLANQSPSLSGAQLANQSPSLLGAQLAAELGELSGSSLGELLGRILSLEGLPQLSEDLLDAELEEMLANWSPYCCWERRNWKPSWESCRVLCW